MLLNLILFALLIICTLICIFVFNMGGEKQVMILMILIIGCIAEYCYYIKYDIVDGPMN